MMPAITVENVYKNFKVYHDKGYSLKEKILFWQRNAYETRTVLNGISFKVNKSGISRLWDARDTIAVGQQGQVLIPPVEP